MRNLLSATRHRGAVNPAMTRFGDNAHRLDAQLNDYDEGVVQTTSHGDGVGDQMIPASIDLDGELSCKPL